jgi:hypothetical protein
VRRRRSHDSPNATPVAERVKELPRGALTDLLVQQTVWVELRLLRPALLRLAQKPVLLVQAPREPQPTAIASFGMLGMRVPVRQLRGIVTTDSARA